jgi:molybdate transport system substrate-binding protein
MTSPISATRRPLSATAAGRLRTVFAATVLCVAAAVSHAADVSVAAPNAVKEAVMDIAARFEKESGHRVRFTWGGSESIAKRVGDGEVFDVVINTSQGIDRLAAAGSLTKDGKADFSRSAVAVAVRSGAPRPDLTTVDGLKAGLLKANSIAISSGASGRYLEQVFQRLGIVEQIKHKIVQPPSGAQIGELLARGEAELGFQQVTELKHAKGIDYLGVLPAELQNYTVWAAGVHAGAPQPAAARDFARALTAPASAAAIRSSGMDPM